MKKITQNIIASKLGVSQPFISKIMREQDKISWPMAQRLSEMFPGKDIVGWKNANPKELKRAFAHLDMEKVA